MRYLSENGTMIEKLKRREGFRGVPYRDTRDIWTVGYGHNLVANPLSPEAVKLLLNHTATSILQDGSRVFGLIEASQTRNLFSQPMNKAEAHILLKWDMDRTQDELLTTFPIAHDVFERWGVRACGLLSMAFQMGCGRLSCFRKMWSNLELAVEVDTEVAWESVAKEALDSQWARNHKKRAEDVAYRLYYNEWPK